MIQHSTTGQIFVCNQCRKIHLEFGNFSYDFSSEAKLNDFLSNLEQIDGQHYEELNKSTNYRRKIIVPIPYTGIRILFTLNELDKIRNLIRSFINRKRKELINITRIEVDFRTFSPQHLN